MLASFVFSFLTPLVVSGFVLGFLVCEGDLVAVVLVEGLALVVVGVLWVWGGGLVSSSSFFVMDSSFFALCFLLFAGGGGGGSTSASSTAASASFLVLRFLLFDVLGVGSVSASTSSVSSFFLFDEDFFAPVDLGFSSVSSSSTSFDTGPVFFCTLGTTQLVLPPTVKYLNVKPLGKVVVLSFFPLPHLCLKSHSSGNLLESARCSTAKPQT